jgi:hypothetical protein
MLSVICLRTLSLLATSNTLKKYSYALRKDDPPVNANIRFIIALCHSKVGDLDQGVKFASGPY